jgi:hypothetical protein
LDGGIIAHKVFENRWWLTSVDLIRRNNGWWIIHWWFCVWFLI